MCIIDKALLYLKMLFDVLLILYIQYPVSGIQECVCVYATCSQLYSSSSGLQGCQTHFAL